VIVVAVLAVAVAAALWWSQRKPAETTTAATQAQPTAPAEPAVTPAAGPEKAAEAQAPAEAAATPDAEAIRKAAEAAAVEPFDPAKPYVVTAEGLVDKRTQLGYKRYHNYCHVCHGPAGKGSSYAPALIDSLKVLSYEDFVETVSNGRSKISTSTTSVMPSFASDPNVMKSLDELYAYLKARADGKVGEGRPTRIGEKILR
jgi:methanol metabolism-related c-type cytochrome